VLFKQEILTKIESGEVTLAFRYWRRPSVKAGGSLRTAVGVLSIESVTRIEEGDIREADARRAGYTSRSALFSTLNERAEGELYRVEFALKGADPRIALREKGDLSSTEREELERRLERLDHSSPLGPWTLATLELIEKRPAVRAGDLAPLLGQELVVFKRNVRKLKELGLTESLEIGYRLSARGQAWLAHLR
jgi:hypothetical protein